MSVDENHVELDSRSAVEVAAEESFGGDEVTEPFRESRDTVGGLVTREHFGAIDDELDPDRWPASMVAVTVFADRDLEAHVSELERHEFGVGTLGQSVECSDESGVEADRKVVALPPSLAGLVRRGI